MIKPKKSKIDPSSIRMAALALLAYAPALVGVFAGLALSIFWVQWRQDWAQAAGAVGIAAFVLKQAGLRLAILTLSAGGGIALSFAFVGLSHKLEGLVPER